MKILIVVAMALWSASAFGVVRCETNGKVEYRDPPCPQGIERPVGGTAGAAPAPAPAAAAIPVPTMRPPVPVTTPATDAQREEENARFVLQERRIREERLRVEAEQAAREAASKPVEAVPDATAPVAASAAPPATTKAPVAGGSAPAYAPVVTNKATSNFGGVWLYLVPLAAIIALAVVQTRRGNGNAWRWCLAAIFGLLSGILLYIIAFMLFQPKGAPGPLFVLITMGGGWVLSAWFMGNGATSSLQVWRRGFLLGAIEWLIVIPASWIWTGRAVVSTAEKLGNTATGVAGAVLGGGLIAVITGGVALFMLACCGVGYLIVHFVQRSQAAPSPEATQEIRVT